MSESIMLEKAKDFAVEIIELCKTVKETKRESVMTNQLIRSGTSVGANIHESKYGHGTADFIAKMQIALKECYESEYWLENPKNFYMARERPRTPKLIPFALRTPAMLPRCFFFIILTFSHIGAKIKVLRKLNNNIICINCGISVHFYFR